MKQLTVLLFLCLSAVFAWADGGTFETAIAIENNETIQFPASDTVRYYKFTLNEKQVIQVPVNDSLSVDLFYEDQNPADYSYDGFLKSYIEAGTYYLKVKNLLNLAFSFTLSSRNAIAGEYCDVPYSLDTTENIHYAALPRDAQFYTYSAQADGRICFSKINGAKVERYADCNMAGDPIEKWYYTNGFAMDVHEGENYLFYVYHELVQNFTWKFIENLEPGSACSNAIEIDNYGIVASSKATGTRYFHYTAQEDTKVHIRSLTAADTGEKVESDLLEIYTNCNGALLESSVFGTVSLDMTLGQEIYIKWNFETENYLDEIFSFEIVKEENVGGSCQNPVVITEPGQFTYQKDFEYNYYSFTPDKDARLIFSDGESIHYVKVKNNCDDYQWLQQESNGELSMIVEKNIRYIIQWGDGYTLNEDFTWTLAMEELMAGETCNNPEIIETTGEVSCQTENETWYYSYTATMDGALRISDGTSVYYNAVHCYTGCGNYGEFDSNGEVMIPCTNGITYIIEWTPNNTSAFTFTITEDSGALGEVPSNPIVIDNFGDAASHSEFELPTGNGVYTYYKYTASQNNKLVLTDNNKYNKVSVNDSLYGNSGELELAVLAGKTYLIRWESFTQSYWYGHLETLTVGTDAAYPIVIEQPGEVSYPAGYENVYYRYTSAAGGAIDIIDDDETAYSSVYQTKYLDAGEVLDFYYTNSAATSFAFTLTERALAAGETRGTAIVIDSEGEQQMAGDLSRTYYEYTCSKDGILTLTDGAGSEYVYVYQYNNYEFIARGEQGEVAFEVKQNQKLSLDWSNYSNALVTWNLSITEPVQGETSENPMPVIEGQNQLFGIEKGLVWNYFSYTPSTNLDVTLVGDPENFYITETATGDTLTWAQYDNAYFEAKANVEYLIAVQKGYGTLSYFSLNQSSEANLKFKVLHNSQDIENAKIMLNANEYTTDNNGEIELMINPGIYTFTIEKEGYQAQSGEISVGEYLQQITSILEPETEPTVSIIFQALNNNDLLNNVYISVYGELLISSTQGIAQTELPTGVYLYSALNTDEKIVAGEFLVYENMDTVKIQFGDAIAETFTVEFTVMYGDSKIENAQIKLGESTAITNEQGFAQIAVSTGTYEYTVTAENYEEYMGSVTINNASKEVQIQLSPLTINTSQNIKVNCFPNPANEYVTIETSESLKSIKVYNTAGGLIYQSLQEKVINVSNWNDGIYIIKIETQKSIGNYKLSVKK
jgi:hypothetical protein